MGYTNAQCGQGNKSRRVHTSNALGIESSRNHYIDSVETMVGERKKGSFDINSERYGNSEINDL